MRNKPAQLPKTSKSSLVSHTFPPFYACYLLKSVKTPKSTVTYIGSTPHPPRRIRQHNGEITQGAWKTARKRPWVMNMIVHGFPSKLAALQFEWAWQHPNLSRHLKGGDMSKGRTLKGNIAVARSMIVTHPYTKWPLHVKLFTPQAVKLWKEACKDATPLPPGFTFTVELEGVDGTRDDVGSGRKGPIDVTDREFTSAHLTKHATMLSMGACHACVICGSNLDIDTTDPLSLALCPTSECMAYAHLTCLASSFSDSVSSSKTSMVPRGGECIKCQKYVLWGDVVRGCYRRRMGRQGTATEQPVIIEETEQDETETGELFSDDELTYTTKPSRRTRKASAVKKPAQRKKVPAVPFEEEGESFDLDAISGSDSSCLSAHSPRVARKTKSPPRPRGRPPGSRNKPKDANRSETISHDIDDFSLTDEEKRDPMVREKFPSRRKSKSSQASDGGIVDALASMRIHDMDVMTDGESILFPLRKTPRHIHERAARRGFATDVIEISD